MVTRADITFTSINGGLTYVSGQLHQVFPSGQAGGGTDYAWIEVRNNATSGTFGSPKAWLTIDPGGAAVAIAIADGTARDEDYLYSGVDPASLTYSAPTSSTAGLSPPSLGPGQRFLLAVRRVLASAAVDYPDANTLHVDGTPS